MSDTECLNINISVPEPPSRASPGKYPVMVFFHGGAFVYASGSAGIYDGRRLAQISQEQDMPTIVIAVTFRLGVYGFLASKEIRAYNEEFDEGGVGNYGLWDQIEALRWIQKHIAAFGGDPDRVTLFGQSAGGGAYRLQFISENYILLTSHLVSCNVHMLRDERLFSAAIIQSGLLPLCGVLSEAQYQVVYDKLLDQLAIPSDLSPRDRLQKLLDVEEAKLTAAMVPVFVTPVITISPCDDHFLINGPMPTYSSYSTFKPPSWCQRVMIGDVANECMIWNKGFRALDAKALVSRIKSFLKDDRKAQRLMELYSITEDMDRNKTFYKIEKFTTDGLYLAVHWSALRAYPQMYAYRFDVPSPFDNDWKGLAHHSLDNVYVWSLLRDALPPHQRLVSEQMSSAWLKFANGIEPWERFDQNRALMIFSDNGGKMVPAEDDLKKRNFKIWETIEQEGLLQDFGELADELCMQHEEILDPTAKPRALEVADFKDLGITTGNQPGGLRLDLE
jgi:carboxylesterase type B